MVTLGLGVFLRKLQKCEIGVNCSNVDVLSDPIVRHCFNNDRIARKTGAIEALHNKEIKLLSAILTDTTEWLSCEWISLC